VADGPPARSGRETYDWVHIKDFSPGLYSNTTQSTELAPIVSAPLGSANPANTFGCIALPGGILGPMPFGTSNAYAPSFPDATTTLLMAGFAVCPGLDSDDNEIIWIVEGDNGSIHYVQAYSHTVTGGATNSIMNATSSTVAGFFGAPYPAWSRMTVSGTGNPPPVLVFPSAVSTDSAGASGHLYVYPALLSPGSFGVQDLIVSHSSTTGQVISYGDRILCLVGQDYTHPSGGGINTNENINFTDPPQSSSYGNQLDLVGDLSEPWGYGAWGTVSVGELILIKKVGGAVVLYGDIDNLTSAINMPGITSTGDFVGSASATPIGLVYCSQNRGAWVWNGGNTSQKLSQNIADDFFDLETNVIGSNNYGFFTYPWQKWVMFSNNYVFDTTGNSWWIISPQATQTIPAIAAGQIDKFSVWWWVQPKDGNQIYACPLVIHSTDTPPIGWVTYDNTGPTFVYSWQSTPIHVAPNADRVVDVRRVVVRASSPDLDPTNQVVVTIGSFTATSSIEIMSTPTPIVFNVGSGAEGLSDIEITVVGYNANGNSAPLIHSIDIGYLDRASVAPDN
jgi:hypothetical protein